MSLGLSPLLSCESKKGGSRRPTAARPSRLLTEFPFDYPKPHVKRGAKYLSAKQTADLARGFTTGSLGPVVRLFSYQRANQQIVTRWKNLLQEKTEKSAQFFLAI